MVTSKLVRFVLLSLLVFVTAAAAAAAPPADVPGQIVLSLQPGQTLSLDKRAGIPHTGIEALDAVISEHGVTNIEPLFGGVVAMFDNPATRADLARHYIVNHADKAGNDAVNAAFGRLSMVEECVSDQLLPVHGTAYMPNDLAGPQWYLRNQSLGGRDIRALGGWAEAMGDTNVVVAVLDTGIDWHHPDLGGSHPDHVNGALWTNWDEYYGTPGVDDDSNGHIDDIRGWDFVNVSAATVWPGEDPGPPDNDPADFEGHGTAVAGCTSPLTDNGIGIAATSPGCKIMAVRIGYMHADGNGYSNATYMAQGFTYATAMGADIINLSYGTGYSSSFFSAIRAALDAGLVICVAAGNDNDQNAGYLQNFADDRVLTVAASQSNDGKSSFSCYGEWIDVTAPGTGIYTTAYSWQTGESTYSSVDGTSLSSPITAGACALIWSANPGWTSAQVADHIQQTCDNIDDVNPGYAGLLGHGRINLLRALGDNVQLVPQEYADVQDALNSATAGDTVKILASEALGHFTVEGKGLQVLGGYAAGYVDRDPLGTPTVVQANGAEPALEFYSDVTLATVVDGFVLRGGGGRTFADIPYSGRYGGGIVISHQSPTLRNLLITDNGVGSSSQLGCGGGILLHNSAAVVENVTITGNTGIYGSGLFIYQGAPTLSDVTIDANIVRLDNMSYSPRGGGLYVADADVSCTNVTVTNHLDVSLGGGIYVADVNGTASLTMTGGEVSGNTTVTNGAGIALFGGSLDLLDVAITGNTPTPAATFMGGGGIYADGTTVILDGVTLTGNEAHSGSALQAASSPDVQIANTLVAGNSASLFGGTIYISNGTSATIASTTVVDNYSSAGGAGLNVVNTPLSLTNTISAFNTGGSTIANGVAASSVTAISCNDVFGNDNANYGGIADPTGSDGNVSVDPEFCNPVEGDYRVDPDGPCAPEQSGGCGLIGALEADCGTVNAVENPEVPVAFSVDQNFPNPFNPVTTIRFALPTAGRTQVVVFDLRGRMVKTLVNGELAAATHVVQWSGDDNHGRPAAAGIYFYRVTSGANQEVGRMALIK